MTSWEKNGKKKKKETVTDFIFLGSKITEDSDCIHKIKRHLLLGREAMINLDNIFKSKDITFLTKPKAMAFLGVLYGCENWTIKRLSTKKLMLSNCGASADS